MFVSHQSLNLELPDCPRRRRHGRIVAICIQQFSPNLPRYNRLQTFFFGVHFEGSLDLTNYTSDCRIHHVMKRKPPTKRVPRLRKLRRDREWSQRYLGRLVGVEGATISLYENGDANPSLDVARDLARVFGCSIEELFEAVEIPA